MSTRTSAGAAALPRDELSRPQRNAPHHDGAPLFALASPAPARDGRTARRQANRDAVVEAVIDLLREGVTVPSVEQIVERAGVSERSLFRYFEGLDDLRAVVVARVLETAFRSHVPIDGTLSERVRHLVDHRLALFEQIAGAARLARSRELEFEITAHWIQLFRESLRAECAAQFDSELARRPRSTAKCLLTSLAVLLSFESWDMQTRGFGHSRAQVRRAWTTTLEVLLG